MLVPELERMLWIFIQTKDHQFGGQESKLCFHIPVCTSHSTETGKISDREKNIVQFLTPQGGDPKAKGMDNVGFQIARKVFRKLTPLSSPRRVTHVAMR